MKVINMVEDFKRVVEESAKIGQWEAFKKYYSKYPKLWDNMLAWLYNVNLEGIEPTVETIDFTQILENVKNNLDKVQEVESLVKKVVRQLNFEDEFEIYIGVGLGHIIGCSVPDEIPMLYIGLECIGYEGVQLEYLIPHEVNHMIRAHYVKELKPTAFRERIITEGLGTLYPLIFNQERVDKETFAKALMMPLEKVNVLFENEEKWTRKVFAKMEFDLSPELMKQFFTYDSNEEAPQLIGYFVGMRMIQKLLEKGNTMAKLTQMAADEIISKYQETL